MRVLARSLVRYANISMNRRDDSLLKFCTNVLGLESLHLGYWNDTISHSLTLENLRKAQKAFSQHLASFVPEKVNHILDIGCGVGDNALLLAEKGYKVTCISPDKNHQAALEVIESERIRFVLTGIENFESDQTYDLALMSESSNYFEMDIGFEKCRSVLRDNGYLLAASLFRKNDSPEYRQFHIEDEWLNSAERHGFNVIRTDDITEHILPNLEFGHLIINRYAIPAKNYLSDFVDNLHGWPLRVCGAFAKPILSRIGDFFSSQYISDLSNPQLFQDKARYSIYLLAF